MSKSATPATSSGSEVPGSSDETQSMRSEPEPAKPPSKKRARRTAKKREPKPKKPKIRTYIRRRTEIEELTDEMKKLKKQMAYFEYRNEVLKQREALIEKEMLNKTMRSVLHEQRLSFASTVSMVTQFFRDSATEPFDLPARLNKDPFQRQAALLRMKHDRLQVAHHFMHQRQHYLSTSEFCDRKRFEATNGDLVSIQFEIMPLPGACSVKNIVDALQFFVYNLEISISEAVGDITIRENDDAKPGSPVAQHRLVATVADMVQTDTNNVAFAEYRPAGPPGSGEQELGLMICDTVDEDELYPYRPETRRASERNTLPRKQVDLMIGSLSPSPTASSSSDAPGTPDKTQTDATPPPKKMRRAATKRMSTKKSKTPKIRTYTRRQTEIEELRDEMKRLKKQMARYESINEILKQRETFAEREMMNKVMRDTLHAQRLSFASTASMLTQFYRDNVTEPFDLPAQLGRDPIKRHAALLRMKKDRLEVAHNFMLQREHFYSTSEFCDRKRFEATNGDFVALRFEITPLPGAHCIKTIIDALQDFVYNLEISISEAIGDIAVRENDDAIPGSPVAQHRLVATIADLVQTDSNIVAFAEYRPPGSGEREVGLMIGDAVDEDELFPYRPETRIRQDMTVITQVAWHEAKHQEPVIVMTRWWCLRLRKSHIYLPPKAVDRICTGVDKVAQAMLFNAQRACGLPT
ncbi:hypothetical protein Pcac1_g21469 [Phytophthora cactorum]|nr:hypothetical protein Pcac1_g21469 [Phytophthora cactorum]KAG2827985.1 hypothetical protein PC111_g8372 [Phytophthora cactorum]